jgi:hypothetical protein
MRKRILSVLLALAVLLGGGVAVVSLTGSASAATSASAPRGWYIDANGLPHLLPHGNDVPGQGGDYKGMWYRGTTLDPAAAPVQLAARPSGLSPVRASFTINGNTPRTVTLTGLPKYSTTALTEVWGSDADALPVGLDVQVVRSAPVVGSTERTFTLTPSGFAAGQTATLTVWVLDITG